MVAIRPSCWSARIFGQQVGPSPFPDATGFGVLLIGDVLEAQRCENAGGPIRTGQRVGEVVVDLAAGRGVLDQRPGSGNTEPSP
jgi:hypothetical protein